MTKQELDLLPLIDLIEALGRRATDYILILNDTPDDPTGSQTWWDGKVNQINWMLDQAKAALTCKFPLHDCQAHGDSHEPD